MTKYSALPAKQKPWLLVVSLFVTNLVVTGSTWNSVGVFTLPIMREFGWTQARVGSLWSIFAGGLAIGPFIIGWFLDHFEARIVMGIGLVTASAAVLAVSLGHSFAALAVGYGILGIGSGASTFVPAVVVITSWFAEKRGRALGLVMAGTTIGAMIFLNLNNYIISRIGWRDCYRVVALLPLLVCLPLTIAFVRNRPPATFSLNTASDEPPGYEVRAAVLTRSFWMLVIIALASGLISGMAIVFLVPVLIYYGYGAATAALGASIVQGCGATGKIASGFIADRVGARPTLALFFLLNILGLWFLIGARHQLSLILAFPTFGLTFVCILTLIPMIQADSLGRKRFGSISGIISPWLLVGLAIGPAITGRIFDIYDNYTPAFVMCMLLALTISVAALLCKPFEQYATAVNGERIPLRSKN